jgi:hypothetical protein
MLKNNLKATFIINFGLSFIILDENINVYLIIYSFSKKKTYIIYFALIITHLMKIITHYVAY